MSTSRAQKILQDLTTARVLTPAGLAWLTLAVDPWHDNQVMGLEGLPDMTIGNSVTFQVVQEMSISKNTAPVALPSGNWSCRVGNFPVLTPENLCPGTVSRGIGISIDNSTTRDLQPIAVQYAADGVDFADTGISGLAPQGLSVPSEYLKGQVRVLGVGIEVINTTSQLHKQGLVSYCRMTQPDSEASTMYVANSSPAQTWYETSVTPLRTLPKNLREMALYPGFAQNEAKEGYYAPVLLKPGRHRSYPVLNSTLLYDVDPTFGSQGAATDSSAYVTRPIRQAIPGANTTEFFSPQNMPMRYDSDSNVVIFSGLSDETTLTLRVRFILERFPSDSEGQMLVISTPTAVYDPVALELYSRAVQRLPAGCPFSENPAGEWWAKMIQEVADAASPFLAAIHPGLGIAAKGIGAIAGAAGSRAKTSRKKKQAKGMQPQVPSGAKSIAASPTTTVQVARRKPLPPIPQKKK